MVEYSGIGGTSRLTSFARAERAMSPGSSLPWDQVAERALVRGTTDVAALRPNSSRGEGARSVQGLPDTYDLPATYQESIWLRPSARHRVRPLVPVLHLEVSDADEDGVFVVSDTFSSVYGADEDADAAIRDYVDNLFNHFDALDRDKATLGAALRTELHALRRRLSRDS